MDQLGVLFKQLLVYSRIFFYGLKCESRSFDGSGEEGQLHIILKGNCTLNYSSHTDNGARGSRTLTKPSVVFFPKPYPHELIPDAKDGTEVVCAMIDFGGRPYNSLVNSLPEISVLEIDLIPTLAPTVGLLLEEAKARHSGHEIALDRLVDYFLIQLIRHLLLTQEIGEGVLRAVKEPRLFRVVAAVHENPARDWSIDDLATIAAMSRASFTQFFRQVIGCSVADYVTQWRIALVKRQLRQGRPMKTIATAVGYKNASALSRVFVRHVGASPTEWLAQNQ